MKIGKHEVVHSARFIAPEDESVEMSFPFGNRTANVRFVFFYGVLTAG